MDKVWVGTSGWSYKDWRGKFYPPGTPARDYLRVYSDIFETVEINNSFYRLPSPEVFRNWAQNTPPGFVFAVKASRYITHIKKLSGVEAPWRRFLDHAGALEEKLGPVLLQFPANWRINSERLANFLKLSPPEVRLVFEFRHDSWLQPDIYKLLDDHKAALCRAYSDTWPQADTVTGGFVFIRLHGHQPTYASRYSRGELERLARTISDYRASGFDIYVYFNNDANAYAVENGRELLGILGGR